MNFDIPPKIEQVGKNREKLLALEKEGNYVFHGSPVAVEVLEPKQAGGSNETTGNWENDGNPGIFASQYADCAIFRSLIYGEEFENEMGINNENQLHFIADKELLERAKDRVGKVYVLEKSKFSNFRGMDCKSNEPVTPLEVIEVSFEDLPKNIKIIEAK